jgi:sugar/nucleoside kinase (ribokinase family)
MSLLVTGSIGIDSVESPYGQVEDVLGGSAAYFSVAAALFGPVRLVGVVGDDFPDEFRQVLDGKDIDLAGLETRQGRQTFRWRGKYEGDMADAETRDVQLNVLGEEGPRIPKTFLDSDFVFLANSHPRLQIEFTEQLPGAKAIVADTMNLWIENEKEGLIELLKKVTGLVINHAEAQQLTEQHNTVKAAREILTMGPKFVVVKKGEHGCLLVSGDDACMLPAIPSENVIDPTGAGDSFAGGMMGLLASGGRLDKLDLRQAIAYGCVAASFAIEQFSLDGLLGASRSGLDKRFNSFREMLKIH